MHVDMHSNVMKQQWCICINTMVKRCDKKRKFLPGIILPFIFGLKTANFGYNPNLILQILRSHFCNTGGTCNILVLDWQKLSICGYMWSVDNHFGKKKKVYNMINKLVRKTRFKFFIYIFFNSCMFHLF